MNLVLVDSDVELRLVDPSRNRFRVYGITVYRNLFGELCLGVAWGRLGHRRLRERSETFANRSALERRRRELLSRRKEHGYVPLGTDWAMLLGTPGADAVRREPASQAATAREIVEAHGLSLHDVVARELVGRWYATAVELRSYLAVRRVPHGEPSLDIEDVSTLAAMYVSACQVA
jgi:predicted DNA-binding WGR domain protein